MKRFKTASVVFAIMAGGIYLKKYLITAEESNTYSLENVLDQPIHFRMLQETAAPTTTSATATGD